MQVRRVNLACACLLICCAPAVAQAPAQPGPVIADAPRAPYLSAEQVDSVALLEPPPVAGTEAARRDLEAVLAAQRAAHAAGTLAHAIADAQADCTRVADALPALGAGAGARADAAAAYQFATRAALLAAESTGAAKSYWHRPRPYVVSPEVERPGEAVAANPPPAPQPGDYSSYPSGFAAFGMTCAIVLAQMVPEERAALFARGRDFGDSRVVMGMHFPTDIAAGRLIAVAAAAVMLQNRQFQSDLRAAQSGLRQALGLPAHPPALAPGSTGS